MKNEDKILHFTVQNRTLPRNCDHSGGHGYIKEELELEPGNGSASAVTVSSAASMNNVNDAAEVLRQRQRWTRRWYLLVIVLLYIGLLASFSLNVSLLLRKPSTSSASVARTAGASDSESNSASAASVTGDETGGDISQQEGKNEFLFSVCLYFFSSIKSSQN